jgi:hypothetical protein
VDKINLRRFRTKAAALALTAMILVPAWSDPAPIPTPAPAPSGRIASFFLSEDFINQLLKEHLKANILQDVSIALDPASNQIMARGLLKIPTDELKALNAEQGIGDFRFQLAIQLKTTKRGHLIIIFPLDQTFFYPASSKDPQQDRVVIPVQLFSLALASARGSLAVMSGDFSGFDKKTQQLKQQIADIDHSLTLTKDPNDRDELQVNRKAAENQLEAIPLERKQAEKMAEKMSGFLKFVGEKEINLNEELAVHRNALILRIQLGQLAPYLEGIELGGVRLLKDEKDGSGENFLAVDINASLMSGYSTENGPHTTRPKTIERPPDIVIRLNQALFESRALVDTEQKDMDKHLKDFSIEFKEDGLHADGKWHEPLIPSIPFSSIIDFTWVSSNVFDIRVREIKILHVDIKLLTHLVLDAAKNRLDKALKGACTFQYIGEEKDHSEAIRATINFATLLPAFPKLALTGIVVKDKELLLKAGQPQP